MDCFPSVALCLNVVTLIVISSCGSSNAGPEFWKLVFGKNTNWEGYYSYKNVSHWCALYVHSVQLTNDGVMYGTFSDGNSSIEFLGKSYDNVTIILEKFTTHAEHFSVIFPKDSEIEIRGKLSGRVNDWKYSGEFIKPSANFKFISLWSHEKREKHYKRDMLAIALPVGVSVSLAIFGIVVMIAMLVWAKKKGYLRHVPLSYKQFDNRERIETVNFDGRSDAIHM